MPLLKVDRDTPIVDGHTDVPSRLFHRPADLGEPLRDGHVDLPRLRRGGVTGLVFALYVPAGLSPEEGLAHALALHEVTRAQLRPGVFEQATTAEEVWRARRRRVPVAILALENGRPLLVPDALERFVRLGVRYVTPTHVASHEWCDASTDAPKNGGLSNEGVRLVRKMNRLGVLADISHVSDDAVLQIVELSATPVLASHSSARALCDVPRNLPDELVREIARKGGVVMANSYPAFVDSTAARRNEERLAGLAGHLGSLAGEERYAARREHLAAHPLPAVPLGRFVDHVVHLVELVGEEGVGIGSDFDGIPDTLDGFADVADYPRLAEALLARGLDRAGVALILGGNFLRLLAEAETRAG